MLVAAILTLSILLQVTAALLALRLIRVTQAKSAWVLIAAAISLMALRRSITLFQMIFLEAPTTVDLTVEVVALVISILMVLGIAWIAPVFISIKKAEETRRLNESRLEALWQLGQMTTASLPEIADFAMESAVNLTKSQIGFVGFMVENGTVLHIQAWSQQVMKQCAVRQKPLVFPLEKAGLWGEVVRQKQPVIINDYNAPHPRKKGVPEGHVALKRLLIIPVLDAGKVVVVAAVGNKEENYDASDMRQLTMLMTGMWWLLERQRGEAALTSEIERMHEFQVKLIQTSADGIIANDTHGNIILFNEGAEQILGYRKDEVIGRLHVTRIYPPGVAREIKKKVKGPEHGGPGRLVQYQTRILAKNGEEIPIELSATLIPENSQEVAIVGIFRDLRERRQLQEKLLESERLATIGRMAGHLSHAMKNPLMAIGGFARQVRDHIGEDPSQNKKHLEVIIDKVQELEKLVAETSNYARLTEPRQAPGDINALLKESCQLMGPHFEEHRINLKLSLDDKLPQMEFDPAHLSQAFLHLLRNALEAMLQGGTLTVTTSHRDNQVLVEFVDTGQGMSPEVLEKSLQAFYSTKPKGSGLGLAICQKIMEAHGGEIRVQSEPRKGTRVTLIFKGRGRSF
ncbi:MAG: GAF domain-containing protein [Syntrophobacterales bacterium]|jgi:PAS domain S-box-containing protein